MERLSDSKNPADSCWKALLKIATTTRYLVTFYTFFFSLGSQVSLVSTDQVGDFCVVTLSSLSLARSPCFFVLSFFLSRKILSLLSCLSVSLTFCESSLFLSPIGRLEPLSVSPLPRDYPLFRDAKILDLFKSNATQKLLFNVANTYEPLLFAYADHPSGLLETNLANLLIPPIVSHVSPCIPANGPMRYESTLNCAKCTACHPCHVFAQTMFTPRNNFKIIYIIYYSFFRIFLSNALKATRM